jgi:hypothetical protein
VVRRTGVQNVLSFQSFSLLGGIVFSMYFSGRAKQSQKKLCRNFLAETLAPLLLGIDSANIKYFVCSDNRN